MSALFGKAQAIAALNDRFRSFAPFCVQSGISGECVVTAGIAALGETCPEVLEIVRSFAAFEEDNDPHGEHDFGAFDHPKAGRVFWKIDYYANAKCEWGSEHPDDPKRSYRVLTVMLAHEY